MLIPLIMLLVGMLGVWLSAGVAVEAARKISKLVGLTEAFIGLTVMSIGTSFPEIFTHIISSIDALKTPSLLQRLSGIAVGANIGSNVIQITFIMGIIGLLVTVKADKKILKFDYWIMLASIALLFIFSIDGLISRAEGIVLAALYIAYLAYLAKKEDAFAKIKLNHNKKKVFGQAFLLVAGLGVLLYSANVVITNAVSLTELWGVTGSFVGVLLVGVSSALPEFTTAVRAILKGSQGISLGTLVGSNITNPLLALGIGAAISTYKLTADLIWYDMPFWFGISLLIFFFFRRGMKLFKSEAVFIIVSYLAYVFFRLKFLAGVI